MKHAPCYFHNSAIYTFCHFICWGLYWWMFVFECHIHWKKLRNFINPHHCLMFWLHFASIFCILPKNNLSSTCTSTLSSKNWQWRGNTNNNYDCIHMWMWFLWGHTRQSSFACLPLLSRNVTLCCSPSMHLSHTNKDMGRGIMPMFMQLTMPWSVWTLIMLKCQRKKTKAQVLYLLLLYAPSWLYPLHASWWNSFGTCRLHIVLLQQFWTL